MNKHSTPISNTSSFNGCLGLTFFTKLVIDRVYRHDNEILRGSTPLHLPYTIGDRRTKESAPLPSPLRSKLGVCYFLKVARTSAQQCMEGMGEEKLYFPLLKSVKRKKAQFRAKCLNFLSRRL